jgi:hypothetical protein
MLLVMALAQGGWGAEAPPGIEVGRPTLLGISGCSINAAVHSHGLPTTWVVEYGSTSQYGRQTKTQSIPARLAAHYRESWEEGWNGWNSWCPKRLHFREGGVAGGYISYEGSPRDDHNHDDGVGTVHLTPYLYPGSVSLSANAPSAYLAGGDPDLRDAWVTQSVRGRDWHANGTELIWWSQAQSNLEVNPSDNAFGPGYKHPNWSYTGRNLTDLLASGQWETARYQLLNDTNLWSFCGNHRGGTAYGAYWSINETQQHLNLDLFHMVMFVDPSNRPTGAIDFDEFELVYHNESLVFPSNGGRLVAHPEGSADQPAALTDGWRHGPGRSWKSAPHPQVPLDFVYEFGHPVTVEIVQLHQHPAAPSREVEVLVSTDGTQWNPLVRGELPESHPHGPNYCFLLKKNLSAPARWAKIRILSGYRAEHWGLGEIELFGSGAVQTPDDDWFHVNADLTELEPGSTLHYRVTATNARGTTTGPDQQLSLPRDTRPEVITGVASRRREGTAKVEGRLNPLGKATTFWFEYGPTAAYGQRTTPRYGGLQITPRLVFDTLRELTPGVEYHYRLMATNETGTSQGDDATFRVE